MWMRRDARRHARRTRIALTRVTHPHPRPRPRRGSASRRRRRHRIGDRLPPSSRRASPDGGLARFTARAGAARPCRTAARSKFNGGLFSAVRSLAGQFSARRAKPAALTAETRAAGAAPRQRTRCTAGTSLATPSQPACTRSACPFLLHLRSLVGELHRAGAAPRSGARSAS